MSKLKIKIIIVNFIQLFFTLCIFENLFLNMYNKKVKEVIK